MFGSILRMRGGLIRWKRGTASQGVRQALAYAFQGSCDSHLHTSTGAEALSAYSDVDGSSLTRFSVVDGSIETDQLDAKQLALWIDGADPETGERRGRELASPTADLLLDGTINAPKTYSIAALVNDDLAAEFEALQDRLRARILTTWQSELNARRGAAGKDRMELSRVEVVELQHRRSRALDPHIHRHLWLNVKVLGEDGRWSNIDSRVAMKMHTMINAEGELAARTDPQWITALARHGFTLDEAGEITELSAAVRPMSRRSNQIEANRAVKLAEWEAAHPGQEPSRDVLTSIDQWAWAKDRPNKPKGVDEGDWEALAREELAQIDRRIVRPRSSVAVRSVELAQIDRDLIAAQAVVEADGRAAGTGGRFSMFDLRAGVMRALAASGAVADRALLTELIEDAVARGVQLTTDMTLGETDVPQHIKGMMSLSTANLKVRLARHFDALSVAGVPVAAEDITALADEVLDAGRTLDEGQTAAAGAIAGTDRLVTVTGPAGSGKTTMLKVAREALERQGRSMIVVAPTKKAASVAGREVGVRASSLHALLVDYGWRFDLDETGAQAWSQLKPGDADPLTGVIYEGPRRYPVAPGDRIVVDEAGMVDLYTANALAVLARQTGASIAMVGDHLQAMPVGHSGAMGTMKRRSGTVVELTAVHRFRDPSYGALTLRMREPENTEEALQIAQDLQERGLLHQVAGEDAAWEYMVDGYFDWAGRGKRIALVTSTNAQAQSINEEIQRRRVAAGELSEKRIAVGQNEQRLLIGDIVQTRRNDRGSGVENRSLWTVASIEKDGSIVLASVEDQTDTATITPDYAAEHVHLAYASTVHGIQGETVDAAIVGPNVDSSGLYVGMTRGRVSNIAVAVALHQQDAVDAIAQTMLRGQQEVSLEDGYAAAQQELGRAARTRPTPETLQGVRWDDRRRRPLGSIIDLDRYTARHEKILADVRGTLTQLVERIGTARRTLTELDARIRTHEARAHAAHVTGTTTDGADNLTVIRARLAERVAADEAARTEQAKTYARSVRVLDAAPLERDHRASQSSVDRQAEDFQRRTASEQQRAAYTEQHRRGPSL